MGWGNPSIAPTAAQNGAAAAAAILPNVPTAAQNAAAITPSIPTAAQNAGAVKAQALPLTQDQSLFGDGSDGAVTLLANATLIRDMQYTTLNTNGNAFDTNGFRVRASVSITQVGNQIYHSLYFGITATRSAAAPGSLYGGGLGAVAVGAGGAVAVAGNPGANVSPAAGGWGGPGAGGTGAAGGAPGQASGGPASISYTLGQLASAAGLSGGGGGGGGGAGVNSTAGPGGGGGGLMLLASPQLLGSGIAAEIGAPGGAATASAGSAAGGGGGGGGGCIFIIARSIAAGWSFTVAGGSGGASLNTGINGTPGANGNIVTSIVQ